MEPDATPPGRPSRSRVTRARALVVAAAGTALAASAIVIALAVSRSAPIVALAEPSSTPSSAPSPTAAPTESIPPSIEPTPTASASAEPGRDPVLGKDGRFTVLLLGSDYRPSHSGNRTDVIMVVSLDPTSGAVAAASIPRDVAAFPTSSSGVYGPKINGLYQSMSGRMGQRKAAAEMKRIVGQGIGVEIDHYAVIGFEGVRQLVNAVGGVDVVLAKAVHDPYYWVTSHKRGVHFPAGRNHLNGETALIFARTRKGDNDFARARRQQLLVAAAVDAVRKRGANRLPQLLGIANRFVRTDLPLASAPQLYALVTKSKVGDARGVVFGPTKWASRANGTSYRLNLAAVRGWTAQWMAPVKPPIPASPAPTPAPSRPPVHDNR